MGQKYDKEIARAWLSKLYLLLAFSTQCDSSGPGVRGGRKRVAIAFLEEFGEPSTFPPDWRQYCKWNRWVSRRDRGS